MSKLADALRSNGATVSVLPVTREAPPVKMEEAAPMSKPQPSRVGTKAITVHEFCHP